MSSPNVASVEPARHERQADAAVAILLVDDDPRNLLALESTLESIEHRLVKAQTAEQALLALMQEDFAAIVLDVQMPDLDGIQLARLIKQRKKTQHIPILFLTAHYRESEHAVLGYGVGAVDYLTKPVHPEVLRSKVGVFVDLFRKTRALAEMNRAMEEEIVERKIAEERFRVVVEAAPSSMLVIAQNGAIVLVNTQAERLFGRERNQLLTAQITDLIGLEVIPPLQKTVAGGAPPLPQIATEPRETAIKRPDGTEVPVEIRLTAIQSDEDSRWLASIVDITERKRAEAALRAQAEAEAANAAKDRFLAMLSHELRTPLSPVLHSVALLNDDPKCSAEMRQGLEVISRNVQLEARLIDDLLDVARIRNGKLQLQTHWIDAHDLLRNALQICAPEFSARNLIMTTHLDAERRVLLADPARLQQIFWNLINNAVKFTPEGGEVTVQTRNPSDGSIIEVEVSDMGAGIPAEKLPRIFDAFEQASRSSTGGLGLGLAICKALSELHGGTISAHSAGSSRGSTFVVRLPVQNGVSVPLAHDSPKTESLESHPLRILLVEDHHDTAETLRRLLVRRKYHVKAASSVGAAIEASRDYAFDVLVTDIGLPDGNGVELFQQLKQIKEHQAVYAIALSGYGMDEDISRSISAGFAHHITKPVEFAQLHRCLKEISQKIAADRESVLPV
jgi:PAS domain S-box-containing protein